MKDTIKVGNGISFGGLLSIVFITLKLCHVIDWSWVWVLSPLWIPLAIAALILLGFLAFSGVCVGIAWALKRWKL
jgi:uncharacterized membrane protein